jgi:bisanhydrobacterioruberin hydratase
MPCILMYYINIDVVNCEFGKYYILFVVVFLFMRNVYLFIIGLFVVLSGVFVTLLDFRPGFVWVSSLFLIALAVPSYYFFVKARGWRGFFVLLLLSFFVYFIESVGVVSGFPYGFFNYTQRLGFFVGVVPWTVSFGWVPLLLASWFLTEKFFSLSFRKSVVFDYFLFLKKLFVGAFIFMVFDFVLDPGAVSIGFWEWHKNGFYYGIPLSNFVGWFFSGLVGLLIVYFIVGENLNTNKSRNMSVSRNVLFSAFFINLFWTVIVFMQGFIVPFIIGIFVALFLGYFLFELDGKKINSLKNL